MGKQTAVKVAGALVAALAILALSACQPLLSISLQPVPTTVSVVVMPPAPQIVLEFWTTDTREAAVNAYGRVAERFAQRNPGVQVLIVPVEPAELGSKIETAQQVNHLPAIIRADVDVLADLREQDLLDVKASNSVVETLGTEDFYAGLLRLVTDPVTQRYFAVPFDGWVNSIWYRADVFEAKGLQPPNTWDALNVACDRVTTPGTEMIYAFVLGTDPDRDYAQQIFEPLAISNNAWPFDEAGNVTMNSPEMVGALQFYSDLHRCSPIGVQYEAGAREKYELDQAGLVFYGTQIMGDLVQGSPLEGGGTMPISVIALAHKTAFVSRFDGPGGSATYGTLGALAIVQGAPAQARAAIQYFLGSNYAEILAVDPTGRVPVIRSGVRVWKEMSSYFPNYADATLNAIPEAYGSLQRWLLRPEYTSRERAVIREMANRRLIPQAISSICLGNAAPDVAAQWLQEQVEGIVSEMGGP